MSSGGLPFVHVHGAVCLGGTLMYRLGWVCPPSQSCSLSTWILSSSVGLAVAVLLCLVAKLIETLSVLGFISAFLINHVS